MITPETHPANAVDAAHLLRMASRISPVNADAEFNFPAAILQALEFAKEGIKPLDPADLATAAEEGMLQIAFFNEGYAVPSPFLVLAVAAGWRYRIGQGFHRVAG
jgi:hypothetical protein